MFTGDYVSTIELKGKQILQVEPEALTLLSEQAFIDIAHLLRPGHLQANKYICVDRPRYRVDMGSYGFARNIFSGWGGVK